MNPTVFVRFGKRNAITEKDICRGLSGKTYQSESDKVGERGLYEGSLINGTGGGKSCSLFDLGIYTKGAPFEGIEY